ncbi:hypothetical protein V496_08791 [Pseudogymnoascus sp. VKM F-4515 (FW-2607)]|nr:hypothetical protein V496_08791 [Pseudogymnoascus sp. VKM F-4515 (FW-2607)]
MDTPMSPTYDHRFKRIGHPVRSAIHKLEIGRLVVGWVTTSEYLLFASSLGMMSGVEKKVQRLDDIKDHVQVEGNNKHTNTIWIAIAVIAFVLDGTPAGELGTMPAKNGNTFDSTATTRAGNNASEDTCGEWQPQ